MLTVCFFGKTDVPGGATHADRSDQSDQILIRFAGEAVRTRQSG
jgi:hypothetical protein